MRRFLATASALALAAAPAGSGHAWIAQKGGPPASTSFEVALSAGGGTISTSNIYFGNQANTTPASARPYIAPTNLTLSNMYCLTNAVSGAGTTWTFTPYIMAAGATSGTDDTNQQAAVTGGTTLTVTYTHTASFTMNTGDALLIHVTFTGAPATTGANCSFDAQ